MTQPHLFVYLWFSVCTSLMCSAGNPGSWSDGDYVSTLNDILKAKGWKKLLTLTLDRELKSIHGKVIDVSDLLNKEVDGNIVTPANYTEKLLKSSTAVTCFYSENIKFINDVFIEIIAKKCMTMDSNALMLDCMERFWETMDITKSIIEQMLKVLNFFHKASKGLGSTTVIDAFESLLPHYDRQKYIKSNYLHHNGTVMMDNFKRDYKYLLDKIKCANKILWYFLRARCLTTCKGENEKSDTIIVIEEATSNPMTYQDISTFIDCYVKNLIKIEKSFLAKLGFDKEHDV